MSWAAPPEPPPTGSMKKIIINKYKKMEKKYLAPAVRAMDLHLDLSFCLSGGLEDTYDDPIDLDD